MPISISMGGIMGVLGSMFSIGIEDIFYLIPFLFCLIFAMFFVCALSLSSTYDKSKLKRVGYLLGVFLILFSGFVVLKLLGLFCNVSLFFGGSFLIFISLFVVFIIDRIKETKHYQWLMENGICLNTIITRVELRRSHLDDPDSSRTFFVFSVGEYPLGTQREYHSTVLSIPGRSIKDMERWVNQSVNVYINPNNKDDYFMDCGFIRTFKYD